MNKTILITGSSRGIGKGIAELAYGKGWTVIVHGSKDSQELKEENVKLKGSLRTNFDIADKEATNKGIKEIINQVGNIDAVVNNAGIVLNYIKDISEMSDEKALEEWRVNVLGTLHVIKAVLPSMLEKHSGSIVNIASMKGYPNYSTMSSFTYSQAKAGVISLTKSLAKAYSGQGVRVNVISPGYVQSGISSIWSEATYKRIIDGTLLGRVAEPKEIAHLALFLASDDASFITGSDIIIDGGYTLKGK